MSLVAYGNSDDSENSDTEDETEAQGEEKTITDDSIADKQEAQSSAQCILSALPPPKQRHVNIEFEEDEVEEAFKKKENVDVTQRKSKVRDPVRITVPLLNQYQEEDAPRAKKPKRSAGKVGLFELLPEPKNVTTKVTGRSLVPHTLTSKTDKTADKKHNITPQVDNPRSMNFFSIGDDPSDKVTSFSQMSSAGFSVGQSSGQSIGGSLKLPKIQSDTIILDSPNKALANKTDQDVTTSKSDTLSTNIPVTNTGDIQDAPLAFKASHAIPTTFISQKIIPEHQDYTYNQSYDEQQEGSDTWELQSGQAEVVQDEQQFMQDKGFLRLLGKKQRGREEINIVDVNADDAIGEVKIEMTKALSREKSVRSSKKKAGEGPTGQQKRKHQITYLAHQAKELEFELKNQWAENRANKKAAQNKYGF